MWIHILIFMVILGVFLAGKMGRLPPEAGNPEEKKLFIRIALTGNIIGMLLTFQSGGDKVYSSGYRMEKEETGAYEEKFKVSVDGEEAGSLYVQVPEKETEGSEEEPETELSEEQQREKELQDMIVQYNQKKTIRSTIIFQMNGMENILNGSSQKTKQETCFQLLVWQQRQQLSLQKNGKHRMLR